MVIFNVTSIYRYLQNRCDNPGSLSAQLLMNSAEACGSERQCCYYQIALEGSQYTDECVPMFTYANRQEILGCYYGSEDALYNRIASAIDSGSITHLLFSMSLLNIVYTGCPDHADGTPNNISIKNVIARLQIKYPNNIHVVPAGTNPCGFLTHIGVQTSAVPICSAEKQITGVGSLIDEFGGRMTINGYIDSDTIDITITTPWGKSFRETVHSGVTLKYSEPYTLYNITIGSIWNYSGTQFVRYTPCYVKSVPTDCVPDWRCNEPRDGIQTDGCGFTRYNVVCDPDIDMPMTIPILGGEVNKTVLGVIITIILLYLAFRGIKL